MDDARAEALAEQRRRWDEVSVGWEKWWLSIETATAPLNERLIERAGLRTGARVLDIATGLGEPALTVARRVGPTGHVLAVDLAPGMLARAARRMEAAGFEHVEFLERDVQDLGLEGAGFDAAVCRFGLMLVHDPVRAARQIGLALAPGATFAAAVWARASKAPFFELPARAMSEVFGMPPIPDPDLRGEPGPTRLGEPALFEQVLVDAGFENVEVEPFTLRYSFASVDEFRRLLGDISSRLREALAGAPATDHVRFAQRLGELVAPFTAPDGSVMLENTVFIGRGTAKR